MAVHPDKKVREVLFSMFPLSYRIKKVPIASEIMDRKLFIDSIETLLEIEDRKDKRTKIVGTQQSAMIDQKKNDLTPIDFEDEQGATALNI